MVDGSACQIAGWARDPDTAAAINVQVYADGRAGTGTLIATISANLLRSDLPFADQNHGYVYTFIGVAKISDGQSHLLYAYAMDATGDANTLLNSSGTSINCGSLQTNVKNFGAKGDGVADDAPAIQAAINATAPGGTVSLPAGTYMLITSSGTAGDTYYPAASCIANIDQHIQNALMLTKPNVSLTGAGKGTILQLGPNAKMRVVDLLSQNDSVRTLVVDGNGAARLRIDQNTGHAYSWPCGLIVDGLVGAVPLASAIRANSNALIQDIEARNALEDGAGEFLASGTQLDRLYAHDNGGFAFGYGSDAGGSGFEIAGGAGVSATNSVSLRNTFGIPVSNGAVNALIQNNVFIGNCATGLGLGSNYAYQGDALNTGIQAIGNWVEQNGSPCLYPGLSIYAGVQNSSVVDNTVVNNAYIGALVADEGSPHPYPLNISFTNNLVANLLPARTQNEGFDFRNRAQGMTIQQNNIHDNGTALSSQVVILDSAQVNSDYASTNTLSYTSPVTYPTPQITSIANAAGGATGAVAPGELVAINGSNLGPAVAVTAALTHSGYYPRLVSGTRVLFDSVPAPVLYASASQVIAVVPYFEYWRDTANIRVEYQGYGSVAASLPVAAAVPGFFSANNAGLGFGRLLSQDGTTNSASNPAYPAGAITVFGTGEGQTDPAGVDARVTSTELPTPRAPITATINGLTAQVQSATEAPGLASGVLKLSLVVPAGVAGGSSVPVQINVGGQAANVVNCAIQVFTVPVSIPIDSVGGSLSPSVTAAIPNVGGWTAQSNSSWIHVVSGSPGTGAGTVGLSIDADTGAARSGTVTVAGKTLTVNQSAPPVVTVSVQHSGNFTPGQNGATYTVTVSNAQSAGPTSGPISVTENLPAGLTIVSMAGSGWNCTSDPISCNWESSLLPGASTSPITVTVNVASGAPSAVTNQVTVLGSGFGPINASDPTNIFGALSFIPITPCRIADTRKPTGPFGGPSITGGTSRDFTIPNSSCNIPSTAQAYSLNVAVVPAGPLGFLRAFPSGQTQPAVATLTSVDGRTKSNAAIVPAGTNDAISIFASNTTDVILDINGYFVPASNTSALAFFPVTPCRIADTRKPAAPLAGPSLIAQQSRTFPILSSSCGIPNTAQAYSLNFAAVPPGPLGFITAYPTGQSRPAVASLNDPTGTIVANAVIVPAGTGGSIDVFASNATDLVIDINGYFAPMASGGLSLYTVPPCRVLDTRKPAGSPPFSGELDIAIAGSCNAPDNAGAFVVSATAVPSTQLGFLTLWPQGQTQPKVATLNAVDGAITSNMAIVPTNNGSVSAFATNPTHLVLDLFGYFASAQGPMPAVSVTSNSQNTVFGQPVTFTITVTGINGVTPTGTVQLLDGVSVLNSNLALSASTPAGTAVATYAPSTPLSVGAHAITALYNGDPSYSASTSAVFTENVNRTSATVTPVMFSVNPAVYGQSVTMSVGVASATVPVAAVPGQVGACLSTGACTVTFLDGLTVIGTPVRVVPGSIAATASIEATLGVGSHASIYAVYNGDADFSTATSSMSTLNVNPDATTTAIQSITPSSVTVGQMVTIVAQVVPAINPAPPPGIAKPVSTISFYDGSTANLIGAPALVDATGTASIQIAAQNPVLANPVVGTHNIFAVYNGGAAQGGNPGDPNYLSSSSPSSALTVSTTSATTSVASRANR